MCYLADDDPADVWDVTHPVAAKPHTCNVCRLPIVKGTKHDRVGVLYDGQWSAFRVHTECHELARDIQLGPCGQFQYILDDVDIGHDVMEHLAEAPDLAVRWANILIRRAREHGGT